MRYRLLATYQGAQYEAGVGPDDTGVVLFAACPPPEELHFEPATGHWRKRVSRAEVQMLYESRPVGMFRGERCVVLDDLGDRLHIVYLGHDAFRAEQLGYWEVDRGVFELITPRQEVTEIVELRLPLPQSGESGSHARPPIPPVPSQANGYPPDLRTDSGQFMRPADLAGQGQASFTPRPAPDAALPAPPGPPGAGRSGSHARVSIPPAEEAPLPLEAEAMRAASAANRRGKKGQGSAADRSPAPVAIQSAGISEPPTAEQLSHDTDVHAVPSWTPPAVPHVAQTIAEIQAPPAPVVTSDPVQAAAPQVPPARAPLAPEHVGSDPRDLAISILSQLEPEPEFPAAPQPDPAEPQAAHAQLATAEPAPPIAIQPGQPGSAETGGSALASTEPSTPQDPAVNAGNVPADPAPIEMTQIDTAVPLATPTPLAASTAPGSAVPANPSAAQASQALPAAQAEQTIQPPVDQPPADQPAPPPADVPVPAPLADQASTAAPVQPAVVATPAVISQAPVAPQAPSAPQTPVGSQTPAAAPTPVAAPTPPVVIDQAPAAASPAIVTEQQAPAPQTDPVGVAPQDNAAMPVAIPAAQPASPEPTNPAPTSPVSASPHLASPGPIGPEPVNPTLASPEPASPEPASLAPVSPEPVKTEQASTGPVGTEPVSTGPVSTGPVNTGPVSTAPASTESASTASASTASASQQPPTIGRRRRATRRRLPTQRIFSDLATQAAIPPTAYAIGVDVDGAMCLIKTDEGFEVFNSAVGARHEVRVFEDEESAYFYLFGVLVAESVRTGALVPRD